MERQEQLREALGKTAPMKLDCEGEEGKVETPFEVENP